MALKINLVDNKNSLIFALSINQINKKIMSYENKVNEILVAHGLDFTIQKWPLSGTNDKGETLVSPYYGLYNSKTGGCINTCKEGYTVSQNAEVVEMVLKGVEKFGSKLQVVKAGSIHEGRRVYLQLAIEGESKIGGTDTIKRYVTVIDSNDGSTGLSVGIGDKVMHCKNQFFKFYKAGNAKIRHTATLEQKILTIPSLIETALDVSIKQVEIYNKFISTPLTKHLADKMVKSVLGYDRVFTSAEKQAKLSTRSLNMMDTLYNNIDTEIKLVGNNVWALFNGVTRYTTHEMKGVKRTNGKDESLLVGAGYKKATTGFNFALSLV